MDNEQQQKSGPAFNTQPAGLEKAVDDFYTKTIKLNLPANGQKWLADNSWWIALIGGLVSLWGAYQYWSLGHYVDSIVRLGSIDGIATAPSLGVFWYVALVSMAVQAVLLLLAVSGLKAHKKVGWNYLFYSSLVSVVTGIIYLLVPNYGIGGLLGMIIGTLIGWFFIFQIRSYFTK